MAHPSSWLSTLNTKLLVFATLACALLIAVACGESAPPPVSPANTPAGAAATLEPTAAPVAATPTVAPAPAGRTFNFPLNPPWAADGKYQAMVFPLVTNSNPGQWDIHSCGSYPTCLIPSAPRFSGLTRYDPVFDGVSLIGDLAKSWEVDASGTEYIFSLHDAQWSDGKPVTAEDIKFNFDRIVEPGATRSRTGFLRDFYEPGAAVVLDEKTLRVPIRAPSPLFLLRISTDYFGMYPKHVMEGMSKDDANIPGNLLGSGAWVFKEFQPQISWEYERNTNFFKTGRPYFDGLKFFIIPDRQRLMAALEVNQVSANYGPASGLDPDQAFDLEAQTNGRLQSKFIRGVVSRALVLDIESPPFDDPRVRRAVFLTLDRQEVQQVIGCFEFGCVETLGRFLPGQIEGTLVTPDEELTQLPGFRQPKDADLAEAKKLMADAGYADGFSVDFNLSTNLYGVRLSEIISSQLKSALGIELRLQPADTATWLSRVGSSESPMSYAATGMSMADPSDYLTQHFSLDVLRNPRGWQHPRITEIQATQALELDTQKRLELFREAADILYQGESHLIPILMGGNAGVLDYRLQNYHEAPITHVYHRWDHMWWDPEAPCPDSRGC